MNSTPGFSRLAATDFVAHGFNQGLDQCRENSRPRTNSNKASTAWIGRREQILEVETKEGCLSFSLIFG